MFVVPPSKRQRLNEPCTHETSESNDQNDQIADQTIRQPRCHLSDLPFPLFALVCEYLELDNKCFTLPVLNKAMKAMFKPSSCCKGHLSVDMRHNTGADQKSVARSLARLAYTPYASSVQCMFWLYKMGDMYPVGTKALVLQTMETVMDNPALHSLKITQDAFQIMQLMLSKLFRANNQTIDHPVNQSINHTYIQPAALSRLRVLELNCWLLDTPQSECELSKLCNWSALRYCTSLETFSFLADFGPDDALVPILDNLPQSLTDLTMYYFDNIYARFNARLRSPAYLPHLAWLHLSGPHDELLPALSTVIPATGQPRPVTALALTIVNPGFNLDWCNQIYILEVACDSRFIDAFCAVSDDALPCLRHLKFTTDLHYSIVVTDCDLLPVFTFASKRPIETLRIHGHDGTCLSVYAAIRCLVSMAGLTSLNLNLLYPFPRSDLYRNELASFMTAGCWSRLTDLTFSYIDWSLQDAICFIKAVQNLITLSVEQDMQEAPFSWIPLVPVVAHYCPRIVSFLIERRQMDCDELIRDYVLDDCSLTELQASYALWPLASTGFQHLQRLKVDGFDLDYLCVRWGLLEYSFEYSDLLTVETRDFNRSCFRFRTLADAPPVDGRSLFFDQLYCLLEAEEQHNQVDCWLEEEEEHNQTDCCLEEEMHYDL